MNESEFELVEGSGNVFRDFGDPHADLKQAKAIIAARIIAVLDERELTVRKAEGMTGFAAADFSRIRNASLGRFTLDRLMKILAALDGRIPDYSSRRSAVARGRSYAVSGLTEAAFEWLESWWGWLRPTPCCGRRHAT